VHHRREILGRHKDYVETALSQLQEQHQPDTTSPRANQLEQASPVHTQPAPVNNRPKHPPVTWRSTFVVRKRLLHTLGRRSTRSRAAWGVVPWGRVSGSSTGLLVLKVKVLFGILPRTWEQQKYTHRNTQSAHLIAPQRNKPIAGDN
jgi:hypothetical protein